ncbi:hypothetical protein ZIOFF_020733 [Zingiber officinale]|uniref:Uncharacterized protein n=1 Tax=Zingiber officinale TaxID=94328 RepID=A0A8J5H0K9_ZINOF|nr:hypothetical protein ZIOFF_020733 [Zingiber officinale]
MVGLMKAVSERLQQQQQQQLPAAEKKPRFRPPLPVKTVVLLAAACFFLGLLLSSVISSLVASENRAGIACDSKDCDRKRRLEEAKTGDVMDQVSRTHQVIQALDKSVSKLEMELAVGRMRLNGGRGGGGGGGGGSYNKQLKKAFVVVGINTAFSSQKRREAVRATWMPTGAKLKRLEEEKGVVVRFVIGHSATSGGAVDRAIDEEDAETKDFLRLDHLEGYHKLSAKTRAFFSTAVAIWDADFFVKVDDDVHLNLGMLVATLAQYRNKPRVYIGCMKSGPVLYQNGFESIPVRSGADKIGPSETWRLCHLVLEISVLSVIRSTIVHGCFAGAQILAVFFDGSAPLAAEEIAEQEAAEALRDARIRKPEADIVVIGSGIGGLCCSGLSARYQQDVLVLESHDLPGGAAHSFDVKGYKFDSGPSLFSGFQSRGLQANPIAQVIPDFEINTTMQQSDLKVLDALGESIPCASYNSWMVYIPEGEFLSRIGPTEFLKDKLEGAAAFCRVLHEKLQQLFLVLCSPKDVNIQTISGASEQCNCLPSKILAYRGQLSIMGDLETYVSLDAVHEWKKLLDAVLPLSSAAMALPPLSIRGDWGAFSTAAARYAPSLLKSFIQMGPQGAFGAMKLLRPFSEILDSLELKHPFIRNWVDLLCFLLAGVKSDGIISAEIVYMFAEWYKPGCVLEYPLDGSGAVVDALVRGLKKFGGRLALGAHVDKIVIENGRATGVKLRSGQFIRAKKAVVSNASMWDTLNLLPVESVPKTYRDQVQATPQCESFMHLHLGFDAHVLLKGVDADQNVVLISIPSVHGKGLAPPGKHVLHAYTPGTEPFGLWEGLDRRSIVYRKLKEERSEVMWRAVERVLGPGFSREKCDVKLVGTPLTHRRFLRRNRGTYGPAIKAGKGTFPGHSTPILQLFCCGDSTFPGIGVPAVAASGAIVANTLVSVKQHSELLDAIGI